MRDKGFTLIELLVVISIIGFLASTTILAINNARMEARDVERLANLKNMEKALEMYYDDHKYYPKIGNAMIYPSVWPDDTYNNWKALSSVLKNYAKIPLDDPSKIVEKGLLNGYYWGYDADPGDNWQTYSIMIRLESKKNDYLEKNDGGYYPSEYEVGPQAVYCTTKYGGSSNWWFGGNMVCSNGN